MSSPLLLLLPLLLLAPGVATVQLLRKRLVRPLDLLEQVLVAFVSGALLNSWWALVLAEFGRFSLTPFALIILLSTLAIFFAAWRSTNRSHNRPPRPTVYSGLALLLLIAAAALSIPASQYFIGGRDHGIYIHTGINIAKQGGILINDSVLSELPGSLQSVVVKPEVNTWKAGLPGPWSEGQRLAGFTIRDTAAGTVAPHAFHLYPALIAVFAAVGGPALALYATLYAGLTALLAIYLVARRVAGERVGVLLLILLVSNAAQLWYLKTPSAEILVMCLFWTGLWALQRSRVNDVVSLALFAGLCFGAIHLTKLDMLLVPIGLVAYWGVRWLRAQLTRADWVSIVAYFALALHAVLHAFFISTIYFVDHLVRAIFPDFLAEPLAAAADGLTYPSDILARIVAQNGQPMLLFVGAALLGLLFLRLLRPLIGRLINAVAPYERWLRLPVVLLIGVWIALQLGTLFQVGLPSTSAFFISRLYLTRIGLVVGMFGFVWLALLVREQPQRLAMWMLFINTFYLFVLGAQAAPDQFWVARRMVPIVFPALMLAGLWAVDDGAQRLLKRVKLPAVTAWVALLGFVAVMLLGFAPHSRAQVGFVEWDGLYGQLERVSAEFQPNDILLIEESGPAYFFTLPLWQIFDHTVFQIVPDKVDDPQLADAVAHWRSRGRRVIWLHESQRTLPEWVLQSAQPTASHRITAPRMEQPKDRIPRTPNTYDIVIELHQFK